MRELWTASVSAVALALCSASLAAAPRVFTETYRASGSGAACDTTYAIAGAEPSDGAKHPVFIYVVGTVEIYYNAQAMAAVKSMAAKGFVAGSVEYHNEIFGTCNQIKQKAACIFKPTSRESAVSKLCARGDCSKGIVVGGFSQGAIIATLARNTDSRVKAAFGMGAMNTYGSYNLAACMDSGKHKLPSKNLRIVNGERDIYAFYQPSRVRAASIAVTGKRCDSFSYSCLNPNGSGWIMVRNSQVRDRSADHCFQRASGDCDGDQDKLDANWKSGRASWTLPANLNWLKTFARP